MYLGFFALTLGLVIVNRRQARLSADVIGRRTAKASKVAGKRLKAAESFMKAGNSEKFYEEMLRALWGYLSDKLSMPVSQLSRENISSTLASKGYSEESTAGLVEVLDECEMARYTPDSSNQMDNVYEKGVKVINNLENCKR